MVAGHMLEPHWKRGRSHPTLGTWESWEGGRA